MCKDVILTIKNFSRCNSLVGMLSILQSFGLNEANKSQTMIGVTVRKNVNIKKHDLADSKNHMYPQELRLLGIKSGHNRF